MGREQGPRSRGIRTLLFIQPSLLAHQLVLGLIHQPLFFPLFFCGCCGFPLPWLGDGAHLLHRSQQVILGPLLNELATLVEAVDVYARHPDPLARSRDSEELSLVGAAHRVAAYHLVAFYYLVLYGVGEVGNGVAEVLDLPLYGIRSPYLSGVAVWNPA